MIFQLIIIGLVFIISYLILITINDNNKKKIHNLNVASNALPILGNTLKFADKKNGGTRFLSKQMKKFGVKPKGTNSYIYLDNLLFEPMVIMCGPEAYKVLNSSSKVGWPSFWKE